eukprot:8737042-Pyramimonas_sp.AAC.1
MKSIDKSTGAMYYWEILCAHKFGVLSRMTCHLREFGFDATKVPLICMMVVESFIKKQRDLVRQQWP